MSSSFHPSHAFIRRASPQGTVGCVVRDARGSLAAATSTGGTPFRPSGRVGDSPLPGCGYYADDVCGAASATGWGEAIAAAALSARTVQRAADVRSAERAARDELTRMSTRVRNDDGDAATAGVIVLHKDGSGAWAFSTPRMARAGWASGGDAWAKVDVDVDNGGDNKPLA